METNMPDEPRRVISGWDELKPYSGLGRTQTQELIDNDQFPPPEKHFHARRVIWFTDTIALWQRWRTMEPTARVGGWTAFVERERGGT